MTDKVEDYSLDESDLDDSFICVACEGSTKHSFRICLNCLDNDTELYLETLGEE